jgi:hypothetical protein
MPARLSFVMHVSPSVVVSRPNVTPFVMHVSPSVVVSRPDVTPFEKKPRL